MFFLKKLYIYLPLDTYISRPTKSTELELMLMYKKKKKYNNFKFMILFNTIAMIVLEKNIYLFQKRLKAIPTLQ